LFVIEKAFVLDEYSFEATFSCLCDREEVDANTRDVKNIIEDVISFAPINLNNKMLYLEKVFFLH